ncbi:hypothetical protein LF934_12015 [Dickeya dadantii]|uniref:hypothetical protein n=1 Tax=Dickeya dadantii TaxID=204038 RepID=UPI001CF4D6D0|nr:hypothetical protein [Dickeya dadantii]MCA7013362.1 hypothetical protein [Dickeya dadantii]
MVKKGGTCAANHTLTRVNPELAIIRFLGTVVLFLGTVVLFLGTEGATNIGMLFDDSQRYE